VTVWVALRQPCQVRLTVYATEHGAGFTIAQTILAGDRTTVAVGKHLHLVAVTAHPLGSDRLSPGQVYAYDMRFQPCSTTDQPAASQPTDSSPTHLGYTLQQALSSALPYPVTVSYFPHHLPTLVLPPDDLNHLQIVHGSCRKPHGGGRDSLPILDELIGQQADQPNARPHQLFFTGDQIYGDDVADPMLFALMEAGDTLLGWEEELPINGLSQSGTTHLKSKQLEPGQRSTIAETEGGFTAGLHNKPECAKSHLFSFGEFCAFYLFTWSPVLWSEEFVQGNDLWGNGKQAQSWDREIKRLQPFLQTLWKVRRALANVPTYMIFDDHDVSDDWCLNQAWCLRVLGKPLGRCTVRNALTAYALFQAWGNTPEQFQEGRSGDRLLNAVECWSASAGDDREAEAAIARYVGLPPSNPITGLPEFRMDGNVLVLERDPHTLTWHYSIRSDRHEVIVLDTRTWRGYPAGRASVEAPPMLISPTAFDRQIRQPLQQTDQLNQAGQSRIEATLVVAPTNLNNIEALDWIQYWSLEQGKIFHHDVGDAWNINKPAFAVLLATLFERRDRIVVLSGDIHYGFATRLSYWSGKAANPTSHTLVQLTSSSFKNEEWKTQLVHTKLKSIAPERPQEWVGWNTPPNLLDMQMSQGILRTVQVPVVKHSPLVQRWRRVRGSLHLTWAIVAATDRDRPDWRYRTEWIPRQPAQPVNWRKDPVWLKSHSPNPPTWLEHLKAGLRSLWHNRWLQEGPEVVGSNNLGVVQFQWSSDAVHGRAIDQQAVIQNLYWYPSWKPDSVVTSRFYSSLQLDAPPVPFPAIDLRHASQHAAATAHPSAILASDDGDSNEATSAPHLQARVKLDE
jgi:hypothetical protein